MSLRLTQAELRAQQVYIESGLEHPRDCSLDELILSRGAFYQEIPLDGREGELITVGNTSIISVNSLTSSRRRRRFAAAHELGHFELHRHMSAVFSDDVNTLINWYKTGEHEQEANWFAAEILMPTALYSKQCLRKPFSPELIDIIIDIFDVSALAAILRYKRCGPVPIFIAHCKKNRVIWTAKSDGFEYRNWLRNQAVPSLSVANEAFENKCSDKGLARKQPITKSVWFDDADRDDVPMFEWCLYSDFDGSCTSVIWED
jgi:Zn-dependent peptidase ImmA (M78 family)